MTPLRFTKLSVFMCDSTRGYSSRLDFVIGPLLLAYCINWQQLCQICCHFGSPHQPRGVHLGCVFFHPMIINHQNRCTKQAITGLDTKWLNLLAQRTRKKFGVLAPKIYHLPDLPLTCVVCCDSHWNLQCCKSKLLSRGPLAVIFYLPSPKIICPGQLGNC